MGNTNSNQINVSSEPLLSITETKTETKKSHFDICWENAYMLINTTFDDGNYFGNIKELFDKYHETPQWKSHKYLKILKNESRNIFGDLLKNLDRDSIAEFYNAVLTDSNKIKEQQANERRKQQQEKDRLYVKNQADNALNIDPNDAVKIIEYIKKNRTGYWYNDTLFSVLNNMEFINIEDPNEVDTLKNRFIAFKCNLRANLALNKN